jgi:hypothetical protein
MTGAYAVNAMFVSSLFWSPISTGINTVKPRLIVFVGGLKKMDMGKR